MQARTRSSCPPRASPAAWPRWSPAVTARLPSSARPAASVTPSTTPPWARAMASRLRATAPTSCTRPAATRRMPTTTRRTGTTSCTTAWSAISAGMSPPRAMRASTTRRQTSGKHLHGIPEKNQRLLFAPAGAALPQPPAGAFCILHRLMVDILAVKSRMKNFSGQFCRNDKSSCKETEWFLKNFWLDITNFMAIIDFC